MKIIVILSGGLDSTVTLYQLKQKYEVVEAVTFNYNQRHKCEIKFAAKTCKTLNLPHSIIDITNLNQFLQGSSLTSKEIKTPHGYYTENSMKMTIVPNRNAIMINIAAGYAVSKKISALGLGVHAADHFIYPDTRPEFIKSQGKTLSLANDCKFKLLTPFLNKNKADIVKRGHQLKVPFENTWTCYEGGIKPCKKCGSCVARNEAFTQNNLKDPLWKI